MGVSYTDYLCSLDDDALAALLRERPDARAEPLPSGVARMAHRLASRGSIGVVFERLDRDAVEVVHAIGVLGDQATPARVAALLDAPAALVVNALDLLSRCALVWPADGEPRFEGALGMVDALREVVHEQIGGDGSIERLARHVRADELRTLARAHGVDVAGLRKPELVEALTEAFGHVRALVARVRALPERLRPPLERAARFGAVDRFDGHGRAGRRDTAVRDLIEAGMLVETDRGAVAVPGAVAVAVWLVDARLTGPPELPRAGPVDAAGATAAAVELVGRMAGLLDRVATTPVPALRSGGIGKRERARLGKAVELDDAELCLLIDLACGAGLVAEGDEGFTTTATADTWRETGLARRWAELADAWWHLPLPPTHRREADGTEIAPPLATTTATTPVRRAVLELAVPDGSLSAVGDVVGWHRPGAVGSRERSDAVTAATLEEARRLGLAAGDVASTLGVALASGVEVDALAALAAEHLVDELGRLRLQSDLTGVLSGHPDVRLARLLDTAADVESRGAATTYRFSAASVRRALDAGWNADALLEGLTALATEDLPQPLTYLVGDVARRHGTTRVHEARTCVVAGEALVDELLAARALRMLRWRRLAPTVLATHTEAAGVLSTLRDAGYSPVLDDGAGAVVLEGVARDHAPSPVVTRRSLPSPEETVARLRAGAEKADSETMPRLAELNPRLDEAELELLAVAVDAGSPVHLTYRSNSGGVTRRVVTPVGLHHRWIDAWCHLRNDERAFTVASILAVAPP